MQCFCACTPIVNSFTTQLNQKWLQNKYSKQFSQFLSTYKSGFGAHDPLPYLKNILLYEDPENNIFVQQDPYFTLKKICHALISSQENVVRLDEKRDEKDVVAAYETMIGGIISSVVCSKGSNFLYTLNTYFYILF